VKFDNGRRKLRGSGVGKNGGGVPQAAQSVGK